MSMYPYIILCERFCLTTVGRLFHAKDFLGLGWQKAEIENRLIQSHQLCARNIAGVRPCIAFAFSYYGPVVISEIKLMVFAGFPMATTASCSNDVQNFFSRIDFTDS